MNSPKTYRKMFVRLLIKKIVHSIQYSDIFWKIKTINNVSTIKKLLSVVTLLNYNNIMYLQIIYGYLQCPTYTVNRLLSSLFMTHKLIAVVFYCTDKNV